MNLNDDLRGGTICLSKGGLKIGDGAKTGTACAAPNGAGVDFMIKGIVYHLADAATNVPLTAATAQGLLTTCLYLICIKGDGTRLSVKGTPVLTADLTAGRSVLHWPAVPDGYCAIGAVKMAVTTSYNFTAGTTALDATGCTATYYDIGVVPAQPLTA